MKCFFFNLAQNGQGFKNIISTNFDLFGGTIWHRARSASPPVRTHRLNLSLPTPQHPSPYPASSHIPKTQNNCVARGEEREEGKRPFATTSASPPRKFPLLQKQNLFTKRKSIQKKRPSNQKKSNSLQKRKTQFLLFILYLFQHLLSPLNLTLLILRKNNIQNNSKYRCRYNTGTTEDQADSLRQMC